MSILGTRAFAHRGLWSPDGPPENSMAAFEAAAAAGVGIELDVQLSKDGVPIVFHDPVLDRMTEASGLVWEHTAEDLAALPLGGTEERIPWLSEVVKGLPMGTPVLVELKVSPVDPLAYLDAVQLALFGAPVEAALMAFDLNLCAAAQAKAPDRTRGVLFPPLTSDNGEALSKRLHDAQGGLGADYVALPHQSLGSIPADLPRFAWTVDTAAALETASGRADAAIFEGLAAEMVLQAMSRP